MRLLLLSLRRLRAGLWVAAGAAFFAGCGAGTIVGTVVDVKGEALPGVAVQVNGTPYQGLSNAVGEYHVKYEPGVLSLYFMKTGYTPGMLVLNVHEMRRVQATPVMLWRLPEGKGVYLYADDNYRKTEFIEPSPLKSTAQNRPAVVYGTTRWPKVQTTEHEPILVCYKMPQYGGKLCQMNLLEVQPTGDDAGGQTVSAWVEGADIPIAMEPMDAPEGLLVRIRTAKPLATGTYAVHWGSLDGEPAQGEPRMFYFSIVDALAPVPEGEKPAPAEEKKEIPPAPKTPPPQEDEDSSAPSEG